VAIALTAAWTGLSLSSASFAQQPTSPTKPNILVIMADDIGYWNISAYNRGMMGYHTPKFRRGTAPPGKPSRCTSTVTCFMTGPHSG